MKKPTLGQRLIAAARTRATMARRALARLRLPRPVLALPALVLLLGRVWPPHRRVGTPARLHRRRVISASSICTIRQAMRFARRVGFKLGSDRQPIHHLHSSSRLRRERREQEGTLGRLIAPWRYSGGLRAA